MSELHVVATIPALPGSEDVVRAALSTLTEATRQEEGCLSYDLFESASAPGTYVTIERWADQAAMDAHLSSEHVAAAFTTADGHLGGNVSIHPLEPVS